MDLITCYILWIVVPIPHTHVSEILVVLDLAGHLIVEFSFGHVLINNFTPRSVGNTERGVNRYLFSIVNFTS